MSKKRRRLLFFSMMLAVVFLAGNGRRFLAVVPVFSEESTAETATTDVTAATETVTTEEATTEAPKKEVKSGWKTKKKKKYYYKKGKYVTGWQMIHGKEYYFNKKGVLQKDQMISKNRYVDKKGVLVDKKEIYALGKNSLTGLKDKLNKTLSGYSGMHSVYIKNLDTNEYLSINNTKVKPASVIKLYNMATVFDQMEKGKLKDSKTLRSNLNSMITVSSNDAYNRLLQTIGHGSISSGIHTITNFCHSQGYEDTNAGGTLSPTYFNRVWLCSSYSTTRDCGHILEDIYRGNLVSEHASEQMLTLLKKQTRKWKIPAGLPSGVKSANKTGEYNTRQHDAAIVFSKKADYVIVIMTENDGAAISHIRNISRMTYDYFNK